MIILQVLLIPLVFLLLLGVVFITGSMTTGSSNYSAHTSYRELDEKESDQPHPANSPLPNPSLPQSNS